MSRSDPPSLPGAFSGYHQTAPGSPDELLSRVGPGTPCGEYLRRYWHPIALASELGARPRLVTTRPGAGTSAIL